MYCYSYLSLSRIYLTCLTATVHLVATVCSYKFMSRRQRLTDTEARVCPTTTVFRQVNAIGITSRLLLTRQLTRLAVAVSVTEVVVIRWIRAAWTAVDAIINCVVTIESFPADP